MTSQSEEEKSRTWLRHSRIRNIAAQEIKSGKQLFVPIKTGDVGLKKNPMAEEVEDIKKSLDFITEEVSAVWMQQKSILDLVEEVKALRRQNVEKDKRITCQKNSHADQ